MKDTHFTVIEIVNKVYDYPDRLPIPRIGEQIIWERLIFSVVNVRHSVLENSTETKIFTQIA